MGSGCNDGAFVPEESPASDSWRDSAIAQCRRRLEQARTPSDRLALVRSLIRLSGGRAAVLLGSEDVRLLKRFGLAQTPDDAVRLVEVDNPAVPEDYFKAERLDTARRRPLQTLSPDAVLRRHTHHRTYTNAAQKAAVRAMLTRSGGSGLMVSMPTGAGKSLLFQLEALRQRVDVPGSCVVVITPTVSLALDHARSLATIPGLEGSRAITGELSRAARQDVLWAFRRGEIPVLLLSPEFALGEAHSALVEAARPASSKNSELGGRLVALFIDEAHIVESWGRSFRPDFQRLPGLLDQLRSVSPHLSVILLSATLPPSARRILRQAYGFAGPWAEINARAPRYEFDIVVKSFSSGPDRLAALEAVIDRAPRPLIVYTGLPNQQNDDKEPGEQLRLSAETLYEHLKSRGYERIALFTGSISDSSERRRIVEQWAADALDVIVATSAFGMGVDKADVRSVIHACLPESPARWYQEIGRASRDGRQGLAACLFTSTPGHERDDVDAAISLATGSWLKREKAELRWRALIGSRSNVRWDNGNQYMTLDLDSVREGLIVRQPNDHNRAWNMSLLTLLQRSGALEVLAVAGGEDGSDNALWDVRILDPLILAEGPSAWDRIEAVRNRELAVARDEVLAFRDMMVGPPEECFVQRAFSLIEEDAGFDLPACGRCPACRAQDIAPPREIKYHGLECEIWQDADARLPDVPAGALLIAPDDPSFERGLGRLLQRLAHAGVEQFLLPQSLIEPAADALVKSSVRLGLLLSHEEWLGAQTALAPLPTALLLRPYEITNAPALAEAQSWRRSGANRSLIVVANPDLVIDGRRADQIVSLLAPYAEEALAAFGPQGREVV